MYSTNEIGHTLLSVEFSKNVGFEGNVLVLRDSRLGSCVLNNSTVTAIVSKLNQLRIHTRPRWGCYLLVIK